MRKHWRLQKVSTETDTRSNSVNRYIGIVLRGRQKPHWLWRLPLEILNGKTVLGSTQLCICYGALGRCGEIMLCQPPAA